MLVRPRGVRPSMPLMVATVVVVFGALVVAALVSSREGGRAAGTFAGTSRAAQDVLAYEDRIYPATLQAGEAIVAGIRADIGDFEMGQITATVWEADTVSRAEVFATSRSVFASARSPASLRGAAAFFDEAFATYQLAAWALYEAGLFSGAERRAFIGFGARIGDRGDQIFDRGAADLQFVRERLGLGPDSRFPQVGRPS